MNYPDALSAAPAAAYRNAPLLLTMRDSLPDVVRAEIERLEPAEIVLAGGTGVVSAAVFNELGTLAPSVVRHSGGDRYATSRALSLGAFGTGNASEAFIATGLDFPDALSAAAAAGSRDAPVLLVNGKSSSVDQATQDALEDLLDDTGPDVIIAGGVGVVSTGVEASVAALSFIGDVHRLGGGNRYETSVVINDFAFNAASTVYLATGGSFADALSGAALAGSTDAPLFVVPRTSVPESTLGALGDLNASNIVLLRGTAALSGAVETLAAC